MNPSLPIVDAPVAAHDATAPAHMPVPAPVPVPRRWPGWLREPLLHFLLAGAALFAADHLLIARQDDPHRIVMSKADDADIRAMFQASRGRQPDAAETRALRQAWLDNEVLYREGLALQMDKGDPTIRERVIFKALSMIDASVVRPPLDDAVLRTWFEAHRGKYDEPARFDFDEAVPPGERSEAAIRALVAQLNRGSGGEVDASLRVFKGRPQANLEESYGADFEAELRAAQPEVWTAIRTRDGWRAMRLRAISPGRRAEYASVRNAVVQDWTDAVMAEKRTAAVRELAKKYHAQIEGVTP